MGDGAVGGVALGDGVQLFVVAGDGVLLLNGESFNLQGGLGKTLARCPLSIRLAPFSMKYPFSVCLGVRDGVG